MSLNRVSFYGKNYATACPFLIKIMRQGITIDKKIMRQGITWKDAFKSPLEAMDFGKMFMRQGIHLGHFLCDRIQGVERFATHPHHFPSQAPPPRDLFGLLGNIRDMPQISKINLLIYLSKVNLGVKS